MAWRLRDISASARNLASGIKTLAPTGARVLCPLTGPSKLARLQPKRHLDTRRSPALQRRLNLRTQLASCSKAMRLSLVLLAAAAAAKRQQPPPPADDRQLFREALQERDFKTALRTAPQAYATWWRQLLKDDPYHVFTETLLIAFLLYLLYGTRRAKTPKKRTRH